MNTQLASNAIREANNAVCSAFETLDFRAAADYLTPDCTYVTFNGMLLRGRNEYIQVHEELMDNFMFRGAHLEGSIDDIRFLDNNVAIVIAHGAIRFRWQKQAPQSRQSINTTVWEKQPDGRWLMTSFHNCRVRKIGAFARWLMRIGKK
ncbi:SgcJ/EcaC family oxidoreductase [Chitinophaga sp. 212800010-3]|uniref:YybH family protein n=1 Tax=unclassified Chitinophaga TaxID=2619133 RepID=UPI002DEC6A76|nr:SnoaL-like domain-containing protein [Chitinophaga sp. 212800010-3]